MQDDAHLLSDDPGDAPPRSTRSAAINALYVRANVSWSGTSPTPGARRAPANPVYDFARYDRLVTDGGGAWDLRVEFTLTGPASAWASGAHGIGVDRPDARLFSAFAGQAAAHFKGRVGRYSVWNEPNWHGWLRPQRLCRNGRCTVTAAPRYRALYLCRARGHQARRSGRPGVDRGDLAVTAPPPFGRSAVDRSAALPARADLPRRDRARLPRHAVRRRLRSPPVRVHARPELARPQPTTSRSARCRACAARCPRSRAPGSCATRAAVRCRSTSPSSPTSRAARVR